MIPELDEALKALVRRDAPDCSKAELVLEAPTKDWAARRNAPTVNLYLYDIREDLRRRERGLSAEIDDDGKIVSRRPGPRYFKLSYLVTAWTNRPEDEHRLLASLLRCFLLHDAMPEDLVSGTLAETGRPLPLTVGMPPPEDRAFADVWSALGGELKPSLDVVVVAPMETGIVYAAKPPPKDGLRMDAEDLVDGGRDKDRHRHVPPTANAAKGTEGPTSAGGTTRRPRRRRQ
jgi:Pvc16 N-terminal domain